jgi:hypothetical protein
VDVFVEGLQTAASALQPPHRRLSAVA